MDLPVQPPLEPMEAELVREVPGGGAWQYEPKWDGFRCIAFRDGKTVELQSKSGQGLTRYFPEAVAYLAALKPDRFVLDGELVIPGPEGLSFDALLARVHPAASRVRMLAETTPSKLLVFDLLVDEHGEDLRALPLRERRARLERFAARAFPKKGPVLLSPATTEPRLAEKLLGTRGTDGVIAKRAEAAYLAGSREGMVKVKPQRTVDCVVGGFRWAADRKRGVGSLLLGLHDDEGLLQHVGYCSSFDAAQREELTKLLPEWIAEPGFTGKKPGGPSRWSTRSGEWEPLATKFVVEVGYDHYSQGRFRHGTQFLRWRPDKAPRQCSMSQLERVPVALHDGFGAVAGE